MTPPVVPTYTYRRPMYIIIILYYFYHIYYSRLRYINDDDDDRSIIIYYNIIYTPQWHKISIQYNIIYYSIGNDGYRLRIYILTGRKYLRFSYRSVALFYLPPFQPGDPRVLSWVPVRNRLSFDIRRGSLSYYIMIIRYYCIIFATIIVSAISLCLFRLSPKQTESNHSTTTNSQWLVSRLRVGGDVILVQGFRTYSTRIDKASLSVVAVAAAAASKSGECFTAAHVCVFIIYAHTHTHMDIRYNII